MTKEKTKLTKEDIQRWYNEIEALLKTDKDLWYEITYKKDAICDIHWMHIRCRYPNKWTHYEKLGDHYDNTYGYGEDCKNNVLERIKEYIATKGEGGEVVCTVGGGIIWETYSGDIHNSWRNNAL